MAVETGTATDHVDLYNKLVTFLTGTALGTQAWTRVWGAAPPYAAPAGVDSDETDILLKGTGISGTDEVFLSFRFYEDATNDIRGIKMRGNDGLVSSAVSYDGHINPSPYMFAPLLNGPMPYWFVASGRRFVMVVKTSTNYATLYGGLIRPFATPGGYPYPMAVGGSMLETRRWSDETYRHTHFVNPGPRVSPDNHSTSTAGATLRLRLPGGDWKLFQNNTVYHGFVFPIRSESTNISFVTNDRPLLGGGYTLTPVCLLINENSTTGEVRGALGAFDGVFHVAGFSNYAENTVTVAGKTYLVVQNAFRTGFEDYWALLLE